jgi:hypothetical protein
LLKDSNQKNKTNKRRDFVFKEKEGDLNQNESLIPMETDLLGTGFSIITSGRHKFGFHID